LLQGLCAARLALGLLVLVDQEMALVRMRHLDLAGTGATEALFRAALRLEFGHLIIRMRARRIQARLRNAARRPFERRYIAMQPAESKPRHRDRFQLLVQTPNAPERKP